MRRKLAACVATAVAAATAAVVVGAPTFAAPEPGRILPVSSAVVEKLGTVDVGSLPPGHDPAPEPIFGPPNLPNPTGADPATLPNPVDDLTEPVGASATGSPQMINQFTAIVQNGWFPPDPVIAVGPNSLIEMVNGGATVYSKAGAVLQTFGLSGLFLGPSTPMTTPLWSDPKVVYDAQSGRFFATIMIFDGCTCSTSGNTDVRIAISSTSDPAGSWFTYSVESNSSNILFDQPKLGVNSDKVLITYNIPAGTKPIVMEKADLLAGTPVLIVYFAPDPSHWNIMPARSLTSTTTEYAVATGGSTLTMFAFTGTPRGVGGTVYTTTDLGISGLSGVPAARQPGTSQTIEVAGNAVQSVVFRSGVLWAVTPTGCVPSGDSSTRACIRFNQVTTAGPLLAQDVTYGRNGLDLYYPSVATTPAGDVYAGFSQSSTTTRPTASMLYAPMGSFSGTVGSHTFGVGTGVYDTSQGGINRNRWGDYLEVAIDPANTNRVWIVGEYGSTSTTDTWRWATSIAQFTAVTVSSLSPNGGLTSGGQTVAITGAGFTGTTSVTFGGVSASFSVNSDTSITATAPANSAGAKDVIVTAGGWSSLASPASRYTYGAPAPVVTGLDPNQGGTGGGNTVLVFGDNFTGASSVTFGGTSASFSVSNDEMIVATAPAHSSGTVHVQVVASGQSSALTSSSQYTYVVAPTVSSVSPNSGLDAGGQWVNVTGTGFFGVTGVTFGGVPSPNVIFNSQTSLTVATPAHSAGTVHVQVTANGGTSSQNSNDLFTFTHEDVAVTSVSPNRGVNSGGQWVSIFGVGFSNTTDVWFGTSGAGFLVMSDTEILAQTPPHSNGTVDVQVVTLGGSSPLTPADRFTYASPPSVSGVSPQFGLTTGGDTVTITGSNFTGATNVTFGGVQASFTVLSSTQIRATSPAVAATQVGFADVRVTAAGVTSATNTNARFLYL